MGQNFVPKEATWVQNFSNVIVGLTANVDALEILCAEYVDNGFGSGGANAITDATVQAGNLAANGPLPAATALQVAEAVGIVNGAGGLLSQIGSAGTSRGYFENMRP
jgi:hypothetical protein